MAASQNTKAQPNLLVGDLWFLGVAGVLERLGLLFFDRLALSGSPGLGGKGNAVKLHRFPDRKDNRTVAKCGNGGFVYGRSGGTGNTVFALGQPSKEELSGAISCTGKPMRFEEIKIKARKNTN